MVFVYTTASTSSSGRTACKIACLFIIGIIVSLLASRVCRAFELRGDERELDARPSGSSRRPRGRAPHRRQPARSRDAAEYRDKEERARATATSRPTARCSSWRSTSATPPSSRSDVAVRGVMQHGVRVLRVEGDRPQRDRGRAAAPPGPHRRRPHVYFNWTEGNPLSYLIRFLVSGDGEVAPVTREVLREPSPTRPADPASTWGDLSR